MLATKIDDIFDDMWALYREKFDTGSAGSVLALATWKKIPYIHVAGECSSPSWRALAYLDTAWQRYSKSKGHPIGQRFISIMADNLTTSRYPYYRAIYEDETQKIPPPLVPECHQQM